jgi:hypothetical protein
MQTKLELSFPLLDLPTELCSRICYFAVLSTEAIEIRCGDSERIPSSEC